MNGGFLDRIQRQARPEVWLVLILAFFALSGLALYLYVMKPAIHDYRALASAVSGSEAEHLIGRSSQSSRAIAALEEEVASLRDRLYGSTSGLPLQKMESHVIDQLQRMSDRHDVRLVSVKPGPVDHVLMFDEQLYHVDVEGGFFALYDWLQATEDELRPMVVKIFELKPGDEPGQVEMNLRLAAYRPRAEDSK